MTTCAKCGEEKDEWNRLPEPRCIGGNERAIDASMSASRSARTLRSSARRAQKDAYLVNKQMRDVRAELDRKQRVEHPVCLCGDTITPGTINADNCLLTPDGWVCGVCRPGPVTP
jgi:hypothetical protein